MKLNPKKKLLISDIYEWYAEKLLKDNPQYWSRYGTISKVKHAFIYTEYKGPGGLNQVLEVISYARFRKIAIELFTRMTIEIIHGAKVSLGHGLGTIEARRIERNFSRKTIDWGRTLQHTKIHGKVNGKHAKLFFFTDEDYCRIYWAKLKRVTNERSYKFSPSKIGMGTQFTQALTNNPNLKYRYKYFPFINTEKKRS